MQVISSLIEKEKTLQTSSVLYYKALRLSDSQAEGKINKSAQGKLLITLNLIQIFLCIPCVGNYQIVFYQK